ncbi:MAG: response regulator [Hyphomonadaceae bacterium]
MADHANASGGLPRAPGRGLVIEDDAVIAMAIREALFEFGFAAADVAYTLSEARAAAESRSYALATIDMRLGAETALAAAQTLRARGAALVFATAFDDAPRADFPEAVFLAKPFDDAALHEAFAKALKRGRKCG